MKETLQFRPKRVGGIIVTYPTNRMQDIPELKFIWSNGIVLTKEPVPGYSGLCTVTDRCGGLGRFRCIHNIIMDRVRSEGLTGVKITTWRKLSAHQLEFRSDVDPRYSNLKPGCDVRKTERILR